MNKCVVSFLSAACALTVFGRELQLRHFYSDHMLFQRDQPVVFAGTGEAGATVKAEMNGVTASARADAKGAWRVELPAMKAGGPYVATVSAGQTTVKLQDVMVGELWFASGQSNMEMPVCGGKWYSLTNGEEVAAAASDPDLRIVNIARQCDCDGPHDDVRALWSRADDPKPVKPFSATGYYFGLELRRRLKVPVGIIESAWGGSRIEPWIPEATLKAHGLRKALADLDLARNPDPNKVPESLQEFRAKKIRELSAWIARVEAAEGSLSKVAKAEWMKPSLDADGWKPGKLDIDSPAFVWFRWEVELPATDGEVALDMDFASDTDAAWFDGRPVGETGIDVPFHWGVKRHYPVGKVEAGRHLVVVRVENHFTSGGIGNPRLTWSGGSVDLSRQAPLVRTETAPDAKTGMRPCCPWEGGPGSGMVRGSNIVPSSIYNAMVAPLDVFRCRGTIWYQGCSNAGEWRLYHGYQKALVDGFRATFSRPDMAFVCVQLAGFIEQRPERRLNDAEVAARAPSEAGLTMIRDEQVRIREVPGCDCATAFDIGDHSDIHPKNKREVGRRLAGLAESLCYGGREKARGPEVVKAVRKGAAVEITFDEPLSVDPEALKGTFTLAGADGLRVWAEAKLVAPRTISVMSAKVPEPASVDYCRVPYVPRGAVFNGERYPLLPFRRSIAPDGGVKWIDGRLLPIEGRAFEGVERYYDRLPSNVTDKVNGGVRSLKRHAAGLQFRFATDARKLRFRWTPSDEVLAKDHMPATAASGIDIYRQDTNGVWHYVKTGRIRDAKAGGSVETDWTPGDPCLVNLPLFNGVKSFSLGLDANASVTALPPRRSGIVKPVVFYGTSITHGGCCSRPGLSFVNIIGRRLDVPVVNLGFAGAGAMELEMSEHLAAVDASCYVLDCLWNMGGPERKVEVNYEPFVRNLRSKRPGVPIVMAEQCDVFCRGPNEKDAFIRRLHAKLVAEGWTDLVYLPKDGMFAGDGEGTVDGCHPNDLGMVSMAEAFGAAVARALGLGLPGDTGVRLSPGILRTFRDGCRRTFVSRIDPSEHVAAFLEIGSPKEKPGSLNARPEFAGHYLDLCATYWELDRLPEARANFARVLRAVAQGMTADGYIGGEYENRRRDYFSLWNQAHAVYGLARCAQAFGDGEARALAVRAADWLARTWEDLGVGVVHYGNSDGCQHLVGLYAFDLMYDLTGDWKYLTLVSRMLGIFEKDSGMKLLSARGCLDLPSRKGIEMLNGMRGVLGFGVRSWGRQDAVDAAGRYWASIADGQVWCTGSSTAKSPTEKLPERFTAEGNAPRILRTEDMANENCVQCGWMRFTREYYAATGEARCADELERTVYNHLLASVASDGSDFAYYQGNCGPKVFRKNSYYQCCRYRGFAIAAHLPEIVLADDGSAVTPLVYAPLEYAAADGFRLSVRTDYPTDGRIAFTATAGKGRELRLRIPGWCEKASLTVNGRTVSCVPEKGFVRLHVSGGGKTEIALDLRMTFRALPCEIGGKPHAAYAYGPLVLVRDTHDGDRLGERLAPGLAFARVPAKGSLVRFEATDAGGRVHALVDYRSACRRDPERDEFELYIPR